jgi:hypothetical protein
MFCYKGGGNAISSFNCHAWFFYLPHTAAAAQLYTGGVFNTEMKISTNDTQCVFCTIMLKINLIYFNR